MLDITISPEQKLFWQQNGYIHLENVFSEECVATMARWFTELEQWPETPGKWMQYFERGKNAERQLCRLENFFPYHDGLRAVMTHPSLMNALQELMGEGAVLFKEKINFKLAGGGAYAPHQDAPAFTTFGQNFHVTVLLPIDDATVENGCLYMVKAAHKNGLYALNADNTIADHVAEEMKWEALPAKRSDLVIFDSYVPHRSYPNSSTTPRRSLYLTYNKAKDGSFREQYFAHKRSSFPPECERVEGADYSQWEATYNVGNPIR